MTKREAEARRVFRERMRTEALKMQAFVDAPLALIGKITCLLIRTDLPLTLQELESALDACRGDVDDRTVDRAIAALGDHSP